MASLLAAGGGGGVAGRLGSGIVSRLNENREHDSDEESSLYEVVKILNELEAGNCALHDPISELIKLLDTAITNTASQWRIDLIGQVFNELGNLLPRDPGERPIPFSIIPPKPLNSASLILRATRPLGFEEFQEHLDKDTTPIRIPGILDRWPALQRWQDAAYFYSMTLGGRRLVPVEIGENYTAADYRSEIMSFRKFMEVYVLDEEPEEVGYLAQHDLFTQIRDLQQDIVIPDYCYTSPPIPLPFSPAALTPGLDTVQQLAEPLVHAWLGPKGTKTPLHTDPYHNILCQVVGYKYLRLYPPEMREYLYPGEIDTHGKDISNTSLVDITPYLPFITGGTGCPGGGPKFGPNWEDLPGNDLGR